MKRIQLCGAVLVLAMLAAAPVFATNYYYVQYSNSDPLTVSGIETFKTNGGIMGGMEVTVTFSNGDSEKLTWQATGALSGGVSSPSWGWSLTEKDDTYDHKWILKNGNHGRITSIFINGGIGNITFDLTTPAGNEGTLNSEKGTTFAPNGLVNSNTNPKILATYSGPVNLTGDPAVGDLYQYLNIQFQNGWLGTDKTLKFKADTDTISPGIHFVVPIPSAVWLLGSGLLGLIGLRRRFQS